MKNLNLLLLFFVFFLYGCPSGTNPEPPQPPTVTTSIGNTVSNTLDNFKNIHFGLIRKYGDRGKQVTKGMLPWQISEFIGQGDAEKIDYSLPKETWGLENRVRQYSKQSDFLLWCGEHIFKEPGEFAPFFEKQYWLQDWGNGDTEFAKQQIRKFCLREFAALDGYIEAWQPYNEYWKHSKDETDEQGRENYRIMISVMIETFDSYDWKKRPLLVTPPLPITAAGTMWDDVPLIDFVPMADKFDAVALNVYSLRKRTADDPQTGDFFTFDIDTKYAKEFIDIAWEFIDANMAGKPLWITECGYPNEMNEGTQNSPVWVDTSNEAVTHTKEIIDYSKAEKAIIFEGFEGSREAFYGRNFLLGVDVDPVTKEHTVREVMPIADLVDSLKIN